MRVVRGVDAAARDDRHQHRRRERDAEHRAEHALAAELAQPEHQQRRPQQVELLFDRERPEVLQQRGPAGLRRVRLVRDDQPPVARVGERGERVRLAACRSSRAGTAARRAMTTASITNSAGSRRRARRIQNRCSETPPGLAALGEQQRRDEVAADDEEHLDAEEAAGREALLVPTDEVVVERRGPRAPRSRAGRRGPGRYPSVVGSRVGRGGGHGAERVFRSGLRVVQFASSTPSLRTQLDRRIVRDVSGRGRTSGMSRRRSAATNAACDPRARRSAHRPRRRPRRSRSCRAVARRRAGRSAPAPVGKSCTNSGSSTRERVEVDAR